MYDALVGKVVISVGNLLPWISEDDRKTMHRVRGDRCAFASSRSSIPKTHVQRALNRRMFSSSVMEFRGGSLHKHRYSLSFTLAHSPALASVAFFVQEAAALRKQQVQSHRLGEFARHAVDDGGLGDLPDVCEVCM